MWSISHGRGGWTVSAIDCPLRIEKPARKREAPDEARATARPQGGIFERAAGTRSFWTIETKYSHAQKAGTRRASLTWRAEEARQRSGRVGRRGSRRGSGPERRRQRGVTETEGTARQQRGSSNARRSTAAGCGTSACRKVSRRVLAAVERCRW